MRQKSNSTPASSETLVRNIRRATRKHHDDPFSLAHALERLRRAIHFEELERREGEDWSVAREYVRSLLRRMAS